MLTFGVAYVADLLMFFLVIDYKLFGLESMLTLQEARFTNLLRTAPAIKPRSRRFLFGDTIVLARKLICSSPSPWAGNVVNYY